MAPARVPRDILMRLNTEIKKVLTVPATREKLTAMGYTFVASTPEQFADRIGHDLDKWGKVIRTVGITAE